MIKLKAGRFTPADSFSAGVKQLRKFNLHIVNKMFRAAEE